ncbi:hypothetical protein CAPTEDRAFT_208857 [Capitella teleta]|uniref:Uncharacterized protein n=1 Tax=Capitella teleta TaxID=283909 RepID=R7UFT3_CAPTE|nr:hypothetical protein CAPTEDRAFT_208857 [Capitella teleta]|eukprot:ELU02142.1 hypothetical protein CAPTEDRAFT_208857 [Capitella teleta]
MALKQKLKEIFDDKIPGFDYKNEFSGRPGTKEQVKEENGEDEDQIGDADSWGDEEEEKEEEEEGEEEEEEEEEDEEGEEEVLLYGKDYHALFDPHAYLIKMDELYRYFAEIEPTNTGTTTATCKKFFTLGTQNPSGRMMPQEFFMFAEMHFGGCGCLTTTNTVESSVLAISIGFR